MMIGGKLSEDARAVPACRARAAPQARNARTIRDCDARSSLHCGRSGRRQM